MACQRTARQYELSTERILCQRVKGCQPSLVPDGVKNLNPSSLEVLSVPHDSREAVHPGSGSDQPVNDGKRLHMLLAPPRRRRPAA